jgi:hypothetical protein
MRAPGGAPLRAGRSAPAGARRACTRARGATNPLSPNLATSVLYGYVRKGYDPDKYYEAREMGAPQEKDAAALDTGRTDPEFTVTRGEERAAEAERVEGLPRGAGACARARAQFASCAAAAAAVGAPRA